MPSKPPPADRDSAPVFSENEVLCRTELAEGAALVEALVGLVAAREPAIDPVAAARAVMDREAEAPTFVAPGVALPHARLEGIEETYRAIATSEGGVRFPGSEEAAMTWPPGHMQKV